MKRPDAATVKPQPPLADGTGAGECRYCHAREGAEHVHGCVQIRRTVVVAGHFSLVLDVPDNWSRDDIESWLNESSTCKDNHMALIEPTGDQCWCETPLWFSFEREATAEDEIELPGATRHEGC